MNKLDYARGVPTPARSRALSYWVDIALVCAALGGTIALLAGVTA